MLLKNELPMKIMWAIDAFDSLKEVENKVIVTLRKFAEQGAIEVYPTYVLSPDQLDLNLEFTKPWLDSYVPAAKRALEHKLKDVVIPGLMPPVVLVREQPSLNRTIETLSNHAEKLSCRFIIVGSHGRKGFQRLVLGSFAESLFLSSPIPVMIVGAQTEATPSHRPLHFLVPNDLASPRSPFFSDVFHFAKHVNADVTLLYSTARPIEPVIQSGVYLFSGGWLPMAQYFAHDQQARKEAAEIVGDKAKAFGIPFSWTADPDCTSVTQSILNYVKQNQIDVIAMAAESGSTKSAVIGSITRQIVRLAPCPVWVCRPRE